jgi:glycerophosphoryl diester phosphodiesterase
VLILAHRGASADAPENTLPAFRAAAAQGADGVELDVMRCGSGELVVCHDEHLDRLAGVDLEVRRTPLWKLQKLDVGRHLGFPASASIPTLEEVFAALPAHFLVNVELKCETVDDGGLSVQVAEYVEREGLSERVLLSSFNSFCLIRVAVRAPSLRRGFLIDPDRSFWLQNAVGVPLCASHSAHPHFSACTPSLVKHWRDAGLQVAAWTVDDPEEAARLRALDVKYCITNRPRALREALEA